MRRAALMFVALLVSANAFAQRTFVASTGTMSLVSFGNNQFHGNGTDGTPDSTIALK